MNTMTRRRRCAGVVLLALAAAVTTSCRSVQPPPDTVMHGAETPGALTRDFPDNLRCRELVMQAKQPAASDTVIRLARSCAYVEDSLRRHRMQDIAAAELLRQGKIVMDIPEFHDEQRLPADARPFLGPVVGIFTSPFLGSFRRSWQVDEHPAGGVLAAYIVVYQERGEMMPASYARYNLAPGLNCLFLGRAGEGYRAWIIQPANRQPCRPSSITASTPSLDVRAMSVPYPQDSLVPASRIEDDSLGRAVFSVPCLGQWCRVGLPGFGPAQRTFCSWAGVTCTRKEERIPSYYDEQQWDELDSSGRWVMRDLRVAIVPQPDNNRFASADFGTRRYLADLYLRDAPGATSILYRKGVRQGKNKVELERVTDPATGRPMLQYVITPDPLPAGLTVLPFRVIGGGPHRHFDVAIPPTNRFRYTMLDPGIWGPCGQACCPTDGM